LHAFVHRPATPGATAVATNPLIMSRAL